ncbi:MAG: 2-oxoisovalerate dehydrogenase, partial [bacterium]|nr:2-oxoisovalerate dehydrogenase [bacterium]
FQVSATGHEALAAIVYHLESDDYLYFYYRDRALALARGISNYDMALGYFAKAESSSGGRMMPSHFSSRDHNVFSVATPTGSQCLPAAGSAWAFKLAGTRQVALCTIGDAATRQGEFYEAVAFALQESLPVVFVVEDNGYGISTPTASMNPYTIQALSGEHMVRVNGRDPFEMFERGGEAVDKARAGGGPTVLWCELDRIASHTCSDDQRVYRPQEEIDEAVRRDPIVAFSQALIDRGDLTAEAWDALQQQIRERVDTEYQQAEAAADPVLGEPDSHVLEPHSVPEPPSAAETVPATMVAAVNTVLRAGLDQRDRMVLFGEDIEDPKGGVFGFTKGLSTAFPGRVVNSPLAEATIIGVGVGMAVAGYRPVFELQFIDFLPPALNQLITQVSCLRWRSKGAWTCPLVLMAPHGAYLPGGAVWHSESKEGLVAGIPGVQVVIPSTPEDAAGLLWTALHSDDPVLFLLPKHLFRQRFEEDGGPIEPIPFGKALVRHTGHDVTLVTWGNCVELADQAAELAAAEGVTVEVIDLRTIVPCDWGAIETSLEKTGRLVVVHEDNRTGGFGNVVITEMTARTERWNLFLAPPQLVARTDTPVPYHPTLEYEVLPDVAQVMDAIRATLE